MHRHNASDALFAGVLAQNTHVNLFVPNSPCSLISLFLTHYFNLVFIGLFNQSMFTVKNFIFDKIMINLLILVFLSEFWLVTGHLN